MQQTPSVDLERKGGDPDPLGLSSALVPDAQLRARPKALAYHRAQNTLIRQLLNPSSDEPTQDTSRRVQIAVWASLAANASLCVLQLYAAAASASLSLTATAIDSVFDIASNALLLWVHRRAARVDRARWPAGGARLETVGNVVYGAMMTAVNLVVVVESVQTLVQRYAEARLMDLHVASLVSVGAALGVKLLLFLYCLSLRSASSQVAMLWEDHRNDLFINGFGLLMSAGGARLIWFLDPLGGLVIGACIAASWTRTITGQLAMLAGRAAPRAEVQQALYTALLCADVGGVRDLVVYHSGEDFEVDTTVSMPGDTPLHAVNTTRARLRESLEALPRVSKARVCIVPDNVKAIEEDEKTPG